MPAARHRSRSPTMVWAVRAMIGTRAMPGSARMAAVASKPSIPGICRSIRITSNAPLGGLLDGGAAVAGHFDVVPALLQRVHDEHLVGRRVFGQQHIQRLARRAQVRQVDRLPRLFAVGARGPLREWHAATRTAAAR